MFHRTIGRLVAGSRSPNRAKRAPVGKRFFRRLEVERLEDRAVPAVDLGTAENFAVLGGQAVTNTGPSVIFGDVGVSPGSAITGFPPGIVTNGTIHASDAVAAQAQSDLTTAYNQVAGLAVTQDLTGQDLGGLTLTAGVYFFSSAAQLTGTLTLDAQGNPNAEFDFQIGSSLTTASNSSVQVINGGDPCDVFWQVGSSATLGTTTSFVGHILALTSISLLHGASVDGSTLARNGSVTLDDNSISIADCFTGSISGHKFNDLNGDGVQQAGEPGLAGLTVFLDTNNNGILDNGETSTTTDANGDYTFPNLGPGTYFVREMQQPGVLQTTPNPAPITLAAGQPVTDVDFGDFLLTSIGGTKFQDTNGNGVRDPGEPGLQGVTIFLDANNNGVLDPGEVSTVTDANGNYTFTNVGPGTYHVREVQQPGFTQTTANPPVIVASSGANVGGVLFGNFQLTSIGGTKFQDTNGNGVRDPGEPGLQGVTIFLDANNNGVLDPGEVSTVTDANGNYTFTNVGPGTYHVREVQQAGFTQTTANPPVIVASSGTNVGGVLFGNFQGGSISGAKFQDTNGNGVWNFGEPALPGVTIFLDANNNGVLDPGERSTVTDRNGNFTFANVGPGTYRVREVQQLVFVQMTSNPADIFVTSGANVSGIRIGNMPVVNLLTASKILLTGRNMTNLMNGTFGRQANFVANLYESFLGRAPALAGLEHYLLLLEAGYSQAQVMAMFRAQFRV
jgi:serine-aspartate repeat-containing protein C/D/E